MDEHPGVVALSRLLIGLGLLLGLLLQIRYKRRSATTGTVVEMREDTRRDFGDRHSPGLAPIIEFTPPGGPPQRITGIYSSPPAYEVGQAVKIRYEPRDPSRASIDRGVLGVWAAPAAFVAAGVALGLLDG